MANITRDQVKQYVDKGNEAVIIEALSEQQFNEGHIPGAVRMSVDEISTLAPKTLSDKNKKIITYCASAQCSASEKAADALKSLGYTDVSAYTGGKADWKEAGLPLETNGDKNMSSGTCSTDGKKAEKAAGSCGSCG